jgi:hypothetical protein
MNLSFKGDVPLLNVGGAQVEVARPVTGKLGKNSVNALAGNPSRRMAELVFT